MDFSSTASLNYVTATCWCCGCSGARITQFGPNKQFLRDNATFFSVLTTDQKLSCEPYQLHQTQTVRSCERSRKGCLAQKQNSHGSQIELEPEECITCGRSTVVTLQKHIWTGSVISYRGIKHRDTVITLVITCWTRNIFIFIRLISVELGIKNKYCLK